jgi:hypothetical protein
MHLVHVGVGSVPWPPRCSRWVLGNRGATVLGDETAVAVQQHKRRDGADTESRAESLLDFS